MQSLDWWLRYDGHLLHVRRNKPSYIECIRYITHASPPDVTGLPSTAHLDGMAAVQRVQVQSTGVVRWHELGPDVVLGEAVVHTQVLDPRGKALIEPQVSPPFLQTQTHTHDRVLINKLRELQLCSKNNKNKFGWNKSFWNLSEDLLASFLHCKRVLSKSKTKHHQVKLKIRYALFTCYKQLSKRKTVYCVAGKH